MFDKKEYKKRYYAENNERLKKYSRDYCKEHKEERAEYNKNWRANNSEKKRLIDRKYYLENKDKVLATNKRWNKWLLVIIRK
jgi:hypothetical protein